MTQKKPVSLDGQHDLEIVLRRMTTKTLHRLKEETGQTDFTDNRGLFQFTSYAIANEIGGSSAQIAEVIRSSDLDYVNKGGDVIVWLDDLDERLVKFAS